jgi:protein required for attachment to host cells
MNLTGRVQSDLKSFSKRPVVRPNWIPRTWIMIIDRHIVRIYEKNKKGLEPIGMALPDMAGKPEITNKSVGRVVSSSGESAHHKYEPHMNESQQEDLSFVHQISDWLDKAVWEDAFDRLILVAPPKILGNFRKVMNQPVQTRIIAEINKDLTKLNERDLREELKKIIWF